MNGNGELIHRYTFTKIFRPETDQAELFAEMVSSKLITQYIHLGYILLDIRSFIDQS